MYEELTKFEVSSHVTLSSVSFVVVFTCIHMNKYLPTLANAGYNRPDCENSTTQPTEIGRQNTLPPAKSGTRRRYWRQKSSSGSHNIKVRCYYWTRKNVLTFKTPLPAGVFITGRLSPKGNLSNIGIVLCSWKTL